jgi:hypothetical protein
LAANSGLHAFDFLANSVLREVHSSISKNRPGAFSPGKPDEFLANYKASLHFLDILEGEKLQMALFLGLCRQLPGFSFQRNPLWESKRIEAFGLFFSEASIPAHVALHHYPS